MRQLLMILILSLTVGVVTQNLAKAAKPAVSLELIDAHRAYQAAKLRMHQYRFVSLPQQRRLLDQQTKFTKAEIVVIERRLRDYQPFLRIGDYSPVRTAVENHQLALLAAEQRLRQIQDNRIALLRLSRQQSQLYQLDVLRAATRRELVSQALERVSIERSAAPGQDGRAM